MATLGLHFGHDAGVAMTQKSGFRVIEAERRLGFRHVCGGNADFRDAVHNWVTELYAQAIGPVRRMAVDDWYTPVCAVLPDALTDLVGEDLTWAYPGSALPNAVVRPLNMGTWSLTRGLEDITVVAVRHHYAHAALAYYTSGAEAALVIALDGTGNYGECGMVCLGEGLELTPVMSFNNRTGPRFGLLYEALARRVHGWQFDTGKLLGLGATGTAQKDVLPILRAMIASNGVRATSPQLYDVLDESGLIGSALRYENTWWEYDRNTGGYLDAFLADSSDDDMVHSYSAIFPDEIRTPNGRCLMVGASPDDGVCRDLAASLQAAVEQDLVRLVVGLAERFPGYSTLCYAGGCALNITANTALTESNEFSRIYIPTSCDDSGVALGAALAAADPADRPNLREPHSWQNLAFAGPSFTDSRDEVLDAVRSMGLDWHELESDEELARYVSKLLADQATVLWIEGAMEIGPRALGHRSLLTSAHWRGARQHVSEKIKGREWFRPVAPICPVELADKYFIGPLGHAETMLFSANVKSEFTELLAEVRHVDGTARLQTVSHAVHPRLHALCYATANHTGVPILINTSANQAGRPILNDFTEAMALLTRTELTAVVLADHCGIVLKTGG